MTHPSALNDVLVARESSVIIRISTDKRLMYREPKFDSLREQTLRQFFHLER